jgi:hypothetical protein
LNQASKASILLSKTLCERIAHVCGGWLLVLSLLFCHFFSPNSNHFRLTLKSPQRVVVILDLFVFQHHGHVLSSTINKY